MPITILVSKLETNEKQQQQNNTKKIIIMKNNKTLEITFLSYHVNDFNCNFPFQIRHTNPFVLMYCICFIWYTCDHLLN